MLRLIIELHPYGDSKYAHEIGRMDLWNDRSGDRDVGNYKAKLTTQGSVYCAQEDKTGEIKDYDRFQSVWFLVAKMLKGMGYEA